MSMSQVSVCKLLLFTLFFTQSLGNLMQPHSFTCCSPVLDSLYLNLSTEYRTYFLSPYWIPGFGNQVRVSNLHISYIRCFESTSKMKPASPSSSFFSFLSKNKHKNNIKKKKNNLAIIFDSFLISYTSNHLIFLALLFKYIHFSPLSPLTTIEHFSKYGPHASSISITQEFATNLILWPCQTHWITALRMEPSNVCVLITLPGDSKAKTLQIGNQCPGPSHHQL